MDKVIQRDKLVFTQRKLEKIDIDLVYTSMAASDKSIFVFGGDNDELFTSSLAVRRYDISDNRWYKMKDMPHYTWAATAQIVDNKIYIIGGGRKYTCNSYNLVYDIDSDSWEEKAAIPTSRKGLVSGVIDGIIYVTSGFRCWMAFNSEPYCYGYNTKTDTWKKCKSPPINRIWAMAVVVDNFLYVLGGYLVSSPNRVITKMEKYDPKSDSWEVMPNMPRYRKESVAVAIDSKIFVLCGSTDDGYITIDYYDVIAGKWITTDIQTPKISLSGVATINNKIYLTAGMDRRKIHDVKVYNRDLYEITYGGMRE